jgi:hypothetical protein
MHAFDYNAANRVNTGGDYAGLPIRRAGDGDHGQSDGPLPVCDN